MELIIPIMLAMALALAAVALLGYEGGLFASRSAGTPSKTPVALAQPAASISSQPTPQQVQKNLEARPAVVKTKSEPAKAPPPAADNPAGTVASHATEVSTDSRPTAVSKVVPAESASGGEGLPAFPMSVEADTAFDKMETPVDALLPAKPHDRRTGRPQAAAHKEPVRKGATAGIATANFGTSLDQMGLTVDAPGPTGSASVLDAPSAAATDSPPAQSAVLDNKLDSKSAQPDLFSDPAGSGDLDGKPMKTPPKHPKIYDASENTPMDPLRNKSFDLNSGKSVPADLTR